jgi:putative membrane-bound dehydrogenase-like protein
MNRLAILLIASAVFVVGASAAPYVPPKTGFDFPIYTNLPPGRQVSGQHAPATTPALSPQEAQGKFTLPEGFEIRLFAAEPMVVNPVFMTWDERGRLWVAELYEYPLGAPKGAKPRDRIKILEDTDADGQADKVHVWADGLNLATGLLLGNGGAYVGQAPHLLFLEDTDGDDRADKQTIVMTGFGLEDRHELLNGFAWGPDGYLYMTHGVFTHSKVRDPDKPDDPGVVMNAALARFHPRTKKFEVFSDGTSNPWGVDFDRYGNAFVSACVIDHLFHMAPGGQFQRQGGVWANSHGYADMHSQRGGLNSIVDHRHHMAAYCGVQVYQGDQWPAEHLGTVLMGNLHDNAIHQDALKPNGSSFTASFQQDVVRANDGWFMPTTTLVGPDGAVWISDWYDKYPCYQNARADPDGVDREHGRIWRVVHTGGQKGKPVPSRPARDMNLARAVTGDLVRLLEHANVWQRRTAQRLLSERRDPGAVPPLTALLQSNKPLDARLAALWTLHGMAALTAEQLRGLAGDREPGLRTWVARLMGERGDATYRDVDVLETLAADPEPVVRLAVATAARQFVSSSLTVNTPPAEKTRGAEIDGILTTLIRASKDGRDPLIPFMIWMAAEPSVGADPAGALNWLRDNGADTLPLSAQLTTKLMRRICDRQQPGLLDDAVAFVGEVASKSDALAVAALDGLLEGQKGKALAPARDVSAVLEKLLASNHAGVKDRAQRLGTLWGNAAAMKRSIDLVNDAAAAEQQRIEAIDVVRKLKNDAAREALMTALRGSTPEPVLLEAVRALGEIGGDDLPGELFTRWAALSPTVRRAASDILAARARWASMFLSALEQKTIPAGDVPATAIRMIMRSDADYGMLAKRAGLVFGRVRDADKDKLAVINAKKKMILGMKGQPDLKAGHAIAQKTCLNCHKLHGEGADVGPDLTGVGRSSLDALLANIIDPNQIIGAGYENVEIETKDGRIVSGRMIENTDTRVRLLAAGPKEEVVAKSDIATLRVSELSVMPEGLEQMPDADFRNMIAYLLNPPADKQPFSWKNESGGGTGGGTGVPPVQGKGESKSKGKKISSNDLPIDRESVSLWNPEWHVDAPDFEGTPRKHVEFAGRRNVLETHPHSREQGSALERTIAVPATGGAKLTFAVAAHERGDWQLRVLVNGKPVHEQRVDRTGGVWKPVSVDLGAFAGQTVKLRLENTANDWAWEFGYWSDVRLETALSQAAR